MRTLLLLSLAALTIGGCKLSKEESSLDRLHNELQNQKKELPKGTPTEDQLGVTYIPGWDTTTNREYDEGGAHIIEVGLEVPGSPDKVREYYEKELGAKAMPTTPPFSSIQKDANGKHYEVDFGPMGDSTHVSIKVYKATG